MADGRDGLAGVEERLHEIDRRGVDAQLIGIHHPARQEQGVEVLRPGARQRHVHAELVGLLEVIPALHVIDGRRDDQGPGAGVVQSFARLGELDLLEPFGDQDRDPHLVQHGSTSCR